MLLYRQFVNIEINEGDFCARPYFLFYPDCDYDCIQDSRIVFSILSSFVLPGKLYFGENIAHPFG